MDPRQPPPQQHPFSRNANAPAASPFSRPSFPPASSSSQPPYPPASHPPPPASSAYPELHSRKPSDPQVYYAPRQYAPEPGPIPTHSSHSRHPSASSVTSGPPMNRGMHPPNSPPQQQSQGPNSHPMPGPYGLPPPRPPPVSVGPPTAFPRGRELPALDSLQRTGGGSSMSISSMLGGPAPSRDPAGPSQYGPPQPGPAPGPPYNQPIHASPRMHSNPAPEYAPFRRPQTPDRHRMYDSRDPRAGPAGSPGGAYSTPEVQRYGTPGTYAQRGPPMTAAEQAREPPREQGRMPGNGVPPRPNSQPKAYQNPNIPPPRPMDMGRPPQGEIYPHRDELRPSEEYNPERPIRVLNYEDPRYLADRDRQERERQEMELRERERRDRDRTLSGSDPGRHPMHQAEYARQMEQRPPPQVYNRPPDPRDPRDPGHWQRPGYDQPRVPYDPAAHHPRRQEYPATTGPPYNGHPSYAQPPVERYPPSSHPSHQHPIPPPGQAPGQPYESPEQQRLNMMHMERQHHQQHQQQLQQQQQHQQHLQQQQHPHHPPQHLQHQIPRTREEQPVPPPSVAYGNVGTGMFGSPRNRSMDELSTTAGQQRNMLGVQEINRKGRISPLPQAVQGAQPQLAGPAGEPGIKSEFGRMFSGIGTGISIASPIPTGAQLPFSGPGLLRREESDGVAQEMAVDSPAKGTGRGKRRKLKDEDARNEDETTGRLTPIGGRAKKAKTHAHHHHQYVQAPASYSTHTNRTPSHHHHHHHHNLEQASSPALPGNPASKGVKGGTPIPSPTSALAKDGPTSHPHGGPRSTPAHTNAKVAHAPPPPSPPPVVIPKPKIIISNKAVLDSVAHRPRTHLGDVVYEPILKPARLQDPRTGRPPRTGYSTTPKPLPWDLIKDKENSTLIVKIGKQHLTPAVREEITSRRFLWGTDVYTDDSDVIAACIHAGWIRGEWPEDVNIDMLGLDEGVNADPPEPNARSRRGKNGQAAAAAAAAAAAEQLAVTTKLTEPPKTGPMRVPENRDLHVELLILPTLEKYASTTRFGIKSREWGGYITTAINGEDTRVRQRATEKHDGISFMITGIQWVTNGATSQNRLRGKARRARIHKALREIELGPSWGGAISNGNIFNSNTNGNVSGPNERGNSAGAGGQAKTQGSGRKSPATASDGDKENRPEFGSVQGARHTDVQEQENEPEKEGAGPQNSVEMADADAGPTTEAQANDDAGDKNAEASPEKSDAVAGVPPTARESSENQSTEVEDEVMEDVESTEIPVPENGTEAKAPAADKEESAAVTPAVHIATTEEKREEGALVEPQEAVPQAKDGAATQAQVEAKDEAAKSTDDPTAKSAGPSSTASTETVEA